MNDLPDGSPAARAALRLVGLIRACDGVGEDSGGFDPWPIARAEANLTAAAKVGRSAVETALAEWQPLYAAERVAQQQYAGPYLRSPERKRATAERCLALRPQIEAGDSGAVMDAITDCISHGVVVPGWLAAEFVARQQRVVRGVCKSWSDPLAFGDYHAASNVAGIRAASVYGPWAYEVACDLLREDPQRALSRDGLYEEVGEKINRSHSQVFALIRSHVSADPDYSPPLAHVRDGLTLGKSIGQVFSEWAQMRQDARLEALGYRVDGDGLWRIEPDPDNQ